MIGILRRLLAHKFDNFQYLVNSKTIDHFSASNDIWEKWNYTLYFVVVFTKKFRILWLNERMVFWIVFRNHPQLPQSSSLRIYLKIIREKIIDLARFFFLWYSIVFQNRICIIIAIEFQDFPQTPLILEKK